LLVLGRFVGFIIRLVVVLGRFVVSTFVHCLFLVVLLFHHSFMAYSWSFC
jgi:hypothetical protein